MPIKTTKLTLDGVAGNILIADINTLIVDATAHRVGIGTATPGYKLTVAGGGVVDFFGGRFNCDDTSGVTTIIDLSATAGSIATLNTTTGNITTLNTTTANIVTVAATTVGANQVNSDSVSVSKNQNAFTRVEVININAGIDANAGYVLDNGTYQAQVLLTGTGFTGFQNYFVITSDAPGGFIIESVASDITIEPLQEANGNGFNVNITASDGFDSGATARDGGNIVLSAGLAVNSGADGGVKIPVIKSGATQAAAGAAANEIFKTSGHATLPDNTLMIGI